MLDPDTAGHAGEGHPQVGGGFQRERRTEDVAIAEVPLGLEHGEDVAVRLGEALVAKCRANEEGIAHARR